MPVDVSTMIELPPIPTMVLENVDIGRGKGIPKGMDGYHIITLDVKTWHVHENQSILLPDESFGQFHSGKFGNVSILKETKEIMAYLKYKMY